uniref:Uncharacterized protein n=1 Tax=Anguilla anguilla TaxID=7936 RepID=A0A0E9SG60_ANGAN
MHHKSSSLCTTILHKILHWRVKKCKSVCKSAFFAFFVNATE